MIFSDVLVHVVAQFNILGKYNLLCGYLVVQSYHKSIINILYRKWYHLFMMLVCPNLGHNSLFNLEATTP